MSGAVLAGIIVGRLWVSQEMLPAIQELIVWFLMVLLVGIGISLAMKTDGSELLSRVRPLYLLLIPLSVLGSLLGAGLAMHLTGGNLWLGVAVGAGFGWYSLSGVILAGELGAAAGALAFLSNTMREILALMVIPAALKAFGMVGMVLGGATTMDVSLPLINRFGSSETSFAALLHGTVLSRLVPVLVPIFAMLAAR